MNNSPSAISRAFSLLIANIQFVLLIYLLDIVNDNVFLPYLGTFSVFLKGLFIIFFMAGICGSLAELTSGQEIIVTVAQFKKNAYRYWWRYLLIYICVHIFNFLLYFKGIVLPLPIVNCFLNVFVLYSFAYLIVRDKYLKMMNTAGQLFSGRWKQILVLAGLQAVQLSVVVSIWLFDVQKFKLIHILGFVEVFLNLWSYIYIVDAIINQHPSIKKSFEYEKELYMINPITRGVLSWLAMRVVNCYPPLFVVLKALTPKDYHFREFNTKVWNKSFYKPGKLVAITCYTSNCLEAYKIAKDFKKCGSKVVMGGPHVTFLPNEALEFCDSVVIGECEGVWKEIVKDYESGQMKKIYTGGSIDEYFDEVHEELLKSPPRVIKDFLETTRGCKFKCHFCTIPGISGGKVRRKPIFQLVELLKIVRKKYRTVEFIDNNIYNDPAYARDLFEAIKPLNIKWVTQCTIDIAKNTQTLELARDSGCKQFLIGFEITQGESDKTLGGKFTMGGKYLEYARRIKEAGIRIKAHFIFGFESDSFRNILKMWKFCMNLNPYFTVFSLMSPLPGSHQYYQTLKENRITNLNWMYYDAQNLVFKHQKMNGIAMLIVYQFIRVTFFLTTSNFGRILLLSIVFSLIKFN